MKKILFWCLLFAGGNGFSQGQILSFTIDPANPTTADFVKVYVDLAFSSGSCDLDYQAHNTNGNSTTATAHHCLGMLTVICPITDTFELGYLQAGNHSFNLVLTSGGAPAPCTPGINPDDQDSVSFLVQSGLGTEENNEDNGIRFFPNPANTSATIILNESLVFENTSLHITDALGQIVFTISTIEAGKTELKDLSLSPGIYFLQVFSNGEIHGVEKIIVE